MPLTDCTAHQGLRSAIGPCSAESEAVLAKALSYLGVSYDSTLVLLVRDIATHDGTERIEFDSTTKSWQRVERSTTADQHVKLTRKPETEPGVLASIENLNAVPSPTSSTTSLPPRSLADDWTTLIPATEHGKFFKSTAWHKTALGPLNQWPYALRLMTMKALADPRPANLYWGPTRISIYNQPFSILAANRHPMLMGSPAEVAIPATYPFLAKVFAEIERTGIAFSMPEFELTVEKTGGLVEEAWYDGIYSPIRDTDGSFLGLYNSGYEITEHKMARRNSKLVHEIGAGPASSDISPWLHIVQVCAKYERDIPFLVLYSANSPEVVKSSGLTLRFEGSLGIEKTHPALPETQDLYHGNSGFMPLLRAAKTTELSVALDMPNGKLPDFLSRDVNWRGHGDACAHILASPLYVTGMLTGFLIIGLNPRRPYDESHRQFVEDMTRVASGLLAHGVTVSQAKDREEKLTKELTRRQKFLHQIAEIATVGLSVHNSDGLLTWANTMYHEITGVTRKAQERYNHQGNDYILDEDKVKGKDGFVQCVETKSALTLELRLKKTWRPPDSEEDEPCWIMTTLTPNVEDGETIDVLGCLTDISHLKWAEKVQTGMAESAQRAKQQQERFIDITSHEMRNPLSAVLQCADDIMSTAEKYGHPSSSPKADDVQEVFQTILENAKNISFCATHQTRIVDDILTVSKLDSSMLKTTPVAVNPRTVADQVIQAFAAQMVAEDIQFRLEVQQNYTDLQIDLIYLDPSRVNQILINLVTNALKFTKEAMHREVCIRLNALERPPPDHDPAGRVQWFPSNALLDRRQKPPAPITPDENIYVMFEVEDSGVGMTNEEMKLLFNRFAQASPKTHVTYGGSGLGLFICRELVEIQGGMIGVSSQPGRGSVFAFYIATQRADAAHSTESLEQMPALTESKSVMNPKKRPTKPTPKRSSTDTSLNADPTPRSQTSRSWSILFVEDNLVNQKILGKQLERMGCTVHVANHGAEALDLIKKSDYWMDNKTDGFDIDVVLMDWEMPVMDGVTCTERIRKLEADGSITKRLPIIGATANARPEQVQTALSAGMDDVITKPFTVTALIKRIEPVLP